jgi:PAS domain S-box-containing protein
MRLNVLIVDDEPLHIKIAAENLQEDYSIFVATSAKDAFKTLKDNTIDMILLDINMPQMDGFELARELKKHEQYKDLPIIFLSADESLEYLQKSLEAGGVDYIVKPYKPVKLKHKVAIWASNVKKTYDNKRKTQLLNQYKNTVDTSSIVSKTDKHGIITYVNEKFCEISGYSADELIGKSHNIVRHPDMESSVFKELWETIKAGKTWSGVVKNRKKDGTTYIVDTVINPITDINSNVIEYIGMRHDITELESYKELLKDELNSTQNTLEDNRNYLKQYEDAINSLTYVMKTDTNNIITYVNDRFSQNIGYSNGELLGKNCSEIRDEKHRQKGECEEIRKELSQKRVVNKLLENRTKNGNSIFCTTLFYPILDIGGDVIEHLQVMHDVTDIVKLNEEIELTQKEVVLTMGAIGETRSKETGLHVKRVAEYSYLLAKLFGLDERDASLLKQASPMHDIGKVGIPDSILNKPGKLTDEEFEIMKSHAEIGYDMLKHSKRDILKTSAVVAYTHHEKWDGSGYPNGLKGDDIPIEGRITAVADVFDALGHDRVYKKAWELEQILELFEKEKAKHFDPKLIDIFFKNLDQFLEIKDKFEDNF